MAVARKRKNGNGGTPNGSTLSKRQMKRKARGTMILNDADARIVKRFIPYA